MFDMKFSRFVAVLGLLVLVGSCTGEGGDQASTEGPEGDDQDSTQVIKIGLLAPLTGSAAADGEEYERGAQLAVDEINEAGGVAGYQLELVVGDTRDLSPDATSSAIRRIGGDPDVEVFMTGYANLTNFEIDLIADLGLPYFVTGNASQTKQIIAQDPAKYTGIVSLSPDYDAYGLFASYVDSLVQEGAFEPRTQSVFVITSDNPYSRDLAEDMINGFEELGWSIVGNEVTPSQDIGDWGTVLAKIRAAEPDVVVNSDFTPGNEAIFLEQFLQNPTRSLLYLDYAPSLPEFMELTGDSATGILSAVAGAPLPELDRTQEIQSKFEEAYGVRSGKYGIALYESVYLYADVVEKVGDPADHEAVRQAIMETSKDIGMGHLVFDPETHLAMTGPDTYPFPIWQVWDQELELVSPEGYATGSFRTPPWFED